jgi:hypothetical protein
MAKREKHLRIWYDSEGDYLGVIFDQKAGYFRETENDQVMEKVDDEGNVLGFSVLGVSVMKEKPLEVTLSARLFRQENHPAQRARTSTS